MGLYVLIFGGFLLFLVIGAAFGFGAHRRVRDLEQTVAALRRVITGLDQTVRDLAAQAPPSADQPGQAPGVQEPDTTPDRDTTDGTDAESEPEDGPEEPDEPGVFPESPAEPSYPMPPPVAETLSRPITRESLEKSIASKWFVWLGGVALALSGLFMVKYSIEHGLLGPTTRIVLGLLMATLFGAAGEWIRRKQPAAVASLKNQELIPAALSAAAVATAFGSVYAGYALYGLFSSTIAFGCLVLIAASAVLLSMLHGPFVAALGLIGAYLVPVLVSTGSNSAWRLFSYLTVINMGGLTVVRYFGWRWLQNSVLVVAAGWALLWMVTHTGGGDAIPLSVYLIILLLLNFISVLWPGAPVRGGASGDTADHVSETYFPFAVATVVTLLFCLLVVQAGQNAGSLVGFTVLALVLLGIAWRSDGFELLTVLGAVGSLIIVATWRLQDITPVISALPGESKTVAIDSHSIRSIALAALFYGGLFGIAGFAGLWRARRPGIWAAVSAAVPILMLTILFWRVFDLQINFKWAGIGLVLAGTALGCARLVSKKRASPGFDEALAAYAVAVVAAVALACAMALRDAWLSVALAATIPAIAWINSRLGVVALRYTAAVVGAVVLGRLALNPYIFDYGLQGWFGFNWILYGYGVPALALYAAARLFRRDADDWLVICLESAALLFFVLLMSFEIRHIVLGGRLDIGRYGFIEQCLHSVAWGVTAFGLFRQLGRGKRPVALWGYRILGCMSIGQVVFLQTLLLNPVVNRTDVGNLPVINVLFLAYLLPAAICVLAYREARLQGEKYIEQATGFLAVVLLFVYLTLETRHAFRGSYLDSGLMSDAELYSYSICWLIYAGVLLFLAVLKKVAAMRYGSLAVTLLAIGKVFLIDMGTLTGLYRAGSFLALGIVLIGIGYFYQRFVFAGSAHEETAETG